MIKFLHTRIRVADMDRSIAFYEKLGYTEARRQAVRSTQQRQDHGEQLPHNPLRQ